VNANPEFQKAWLLGIWSGLTTEPVYASRRRGGSAAMVLPHYLEASLDAPKSNVALISSLYSFTPSSHALFPPSNCV